MRKELCRHVRRSARSNAQALISGNFYGWRIQFETMGIQPRSSGNLDKSAATTSYIKHPGTLGDVLNSPFVLPFLDLIVPIKFF